MKPEGLHETHAEHHDQLYLLRQAHLQLEQLGNRQREDGQIERNLDGGADPRKEIDVDTFTLRLSGPALPEVRNRCALKDHTERVGDTETYRHSHKRVDRCPKLTSAENSKIERQE